MEMNKNIVKAFANHLADETFNLKLWGMENVVKVGEGEPKFTIIINKFPSKKELLSDASVALGEAYMDGDIDFEGRSTRNI